MSNTQNNVPKLRFPGFDEAWERRKLSDVLSLIKDGTHGTHADAKEGPLLLSAKNIKDGTIKWDDTDRRISQIEYEKIHSKFSLKNGDVLLTIVGSIGETAILKDSKGLTFQRSVAFLRPCDCISSEFLYTSIQTSTFQNELESRKSLSAQPGIYLGDLAEIPFSFPNQKEEQAQIGELFANVNILITLQQRKVDQIKEYKKGMLQKMFPKEGETVPEVRFPGFSGEWDQKKLGDISKKVTEKNAALKYDETLTNSAEFGIINQRQFFDKDISNKENINGYYVVRDDDFVYNPRISAKAPVGPISRNKLGRTGIMSPLYTVFRTHDVENEYLEWFFKSDHWHSYMYFNGDSGARSDRFSIKDSVFFEMPIPLPPTTEQQRIGEFFSRLDTLITLHQRKLDAMKEYKKGLLQQMFV